MSGNAIDMDNYQIKLNEKMEKNVSGYEFADF